MNWVSGSYFCRVLDRSDALVRQGGFAARLIALTIGLIGPDAVAQTAGMSPVPGRQTGSSPRVHASEKPDRWTLQTLGEVQLHSPIVRLSDLVLPIGIPDAVWEELGPAAVTLVPTDGRRLTIERQRLLEYVQRHLRPEQRVRWTGPELIYVQYRGDVRKVAFPSALKSETSVAAQNAVHKFSTETSVNQTHAPPPKPASADAHKPIRQLAYATPLDGPGLQAFNGYSTDATESSDSATLPVREVTRLTRLIESAIEAQWPEIAETFDLEVDSEHDGLRQLRSIRRIETLRLLEPVRSGSQLIQINATTIEDSVTAEIKLHASPRPEAVFVRNNIRRGQRIQRTDLERRRLARSQAADNLVEDIDQVLGLEACTSLNPNRPLRRDDLKAPTVIRRGDLIELRVAGGGIVVRSNAKALGDGSVGELIEIETVQPRKRLMASVVQSGQVEILTRAPNLTR